MTIERRTFLGIVAASPLAKFFSALRPAPLPPETTGLRLELAPLESFEPPVYRLQYRPVLDGLGPLSEWRDLEDVETEPARGGSLPVRGRDGELEVSFEVTFADDFGEDKIEPGGYEFRVLDPEDEP